MAYPPETISQLRRNLGETVPTGGTEADTMFSISDIIGLLDAADGNLAGASLEGWRSKAAEYANLVTVTDGAASRQMSDLLDNALKMVTLYEKLAPGGAATGRTRIGRIVRDAY